jgi:hypothetical protein
LACTVSSGGRYPYDEAKTLYRLGEIALSMGRRSHAHKHLAAASRILSRLGERLYHEHVQRALAGLLSGQGEAAALDAQPRAGLAAAFQTEDLANTASADGTRAIGGRAVTRRWPPQSNPRRYATAPLLE